MRILEICEPLREGVGRHVTDVAVGLAARGHDVHLAYSPHRTDAALLERLQQAPLTLTPMSMRRAPHPSDASALWNLRRYLRRQGPFDIVHAHSSKAGVLARLAVLGTGSRLIYSPHAFATMNQTGTPRLLLVAYAIIERGLAPIASRIVCTATDEYRHARDQLHLSEKKLVTLFNGIDPATFRQETNLRDELGLPPGAPIIGFVGRLEHQKGADIALAALPTILASLPNAILVVIGDGVERPQLEAQARVSGVAASVRWLGVRPAREYFHNFDVLLCPSRYDGGAYTVIEGLYCGLPVICTAVGIAKEVVRDGVNGFMLPSPEPDTLATRTITLLADPERRQRMSDAARRIGEFFYVGRMLDELEQIYLGRLSGPRAPPVDTGFAAATAADGTAPP